MNRIALLWCLATLVSCTRSVSPDGVDSLVAHPNRLRQVMRQCRDNRTAIGDALCNSASEAFRQQFMGDGKAHYTRKP